MERPDARPEMANILNSKELPRGAIVRLEQA